MRQSIYERKVLGLSVNDNKKNRGAHGDSSFMLGQTSPSSENQADITAGIVKIIVFKDGNTRAITGEDGKFWLTGDDRVRKLSAQIAEIREFDPPAPIVIKLETDPPASLRAELSTNKPKKRTAKKILLLTAERKFRSIAPEHSMSAKILRKTISKLNMKTGSCA